jgi:cytochrome bd-type quinol oxidase subunit 2
MKGIWWKILSILLLVYAIIGGFQVEIPHSNIGETMRNVF